MSERGIPNHTPQHNLGWRDIPRSLVVIWNLIVAGACWLWRL